MTYNEVATYQRDYDELASDGQYFGINWIDGEEILVSEWFKTEDERELRIDTVMGFQADYRAEHGATE